MRPPIVRTFFIGGPAGRILVPLALLACGAATGCRSARPPAPWTPAEPYGSVAWHAGSPLSGAGGELRAAQLDPDPDAAWSVRLSIWSWDGAGLDAWLPLDRAAEIVSAPADPLRPAARRAGRVRVRAGEESDAGPRPEPAETALIAELVCALPGGSTAIFRAPGALAESAERAFDLALEVHRPAGEEAAWIALSIEDPDAQGYDERLLLALRPGLRERVWMASPDGSVAGAVRLFELALDAAPDAKSDPQGAAAHRALAAAAIESAQRAGRAVDGRTEPLGRDSRRAARIAVALAGLVDGSDAQRDPEALRRKILFLAEAADAPLTADLALLSSATRLEALASLLIERFAAGAPADPDRAGWDVERTGWRLLAGSAAREDLPHELSALLLRHAGEFGRFPSAIEELAGSGASRSVFAQRLADENRAFLEDPSPGARVRALAWLEERGVAPAGFDPLADVRARRAALEEARLGAAQGDLR